MRNEKDLIGPKHGTLGALTVKQLQERVMPALNASICSSANMSHMMRTIKSRDKVQVLLRHVEFFTGLSASFPLEAECSRWPGLLQRLRTECNRRGRLNARTVLPIDFEKHGLYVVDDLDESNDEVFVKMRYTRAVSKVGAGEFRKRPKSLGDIGIRHNHSETLAELYCGDADGVVALRGFFTDQQLKQPLSLQDMVSNNHAEGMLWYAPIEQARTIFKCKGVSECNDVLAVHCSWRMIAPLLAAGARVDAQTLRRAHRPSGESFRRSVVVQGMGILNRVCCSAVFYACVSRAGNLVEAYQR
eukprot:6492336-Amphidinium_carterae.3